MAEVFFTIFLFIAITGITAVLFGGWVILTVFRVLGRGLGLLFGGSGHVRPVTMRSPNMRTCPNASCKMSNPTDARFCRRCGTHLPEAQRVSVRRAAMW